MVCRCRAVQSSGNRSSTSGRASASTMKRLVAQVAQRASRKLTVPRSPQCRSSSTSSTGCAAHSAVSQSSNARRMPSPISWGLARAVRSGLAPLVREPHVGDLAEELGDPTRGLAIDVAGHARAPAFRCRASSGSPSTMPAVAPDGAGEHREGGPGAHRVHAAEQHLGAIGLALHPLDQLLPQPRLSDARRADDQHRGGRRLGDRAGVEVGQHRHLAPAADERRSPFRAADARRRSSPARARR